MVAIHQYTDIPVRASFHCDNERLNRIWEVAEHTFRLCSGLFFIDGAKRDQWIWSGDAYQSLFTGRILFADPDIEQRTLTALRGNDPVTTHINTIVDYSLFWVLGVGAHVNAYKDMAFLERTWPKLRSMMAFCEENTEEHGFLIAKSQDWTFVDWAELDKDGPHGAIQMLFAATWRIMGELAGKLGLDGTACHQKWLDIRDRIDSLYWDEEKGAYMDSFTSGRHLISRQTNIWAILFGVADPGKRVRILQNVIGNSAVSPVRTPYF